MKTSYVLIDYENIQPKNIEKLAEFGFKVMVFVGSNQAKIPFELVYSMQMLGSDAEYIKMEGSGQNALDFHIACYAGILSVKNPDSRFFIISRDTGFDPLIKHLSAKKIQITRHDNIDEISILKPAAAKSTDEPAKKTCIQSPVQPAKKESMKPCNAKAAEGSKPAVAPVRKKVSPDTGNEKLDLVLKYLRKQHKSKPATVKTLMSSINSMFQKSLSEGELGSIIDQMVAKKIITRNGTKVAYNLPVLG